MNMIKQHPLASFIILAFFISWISWVPLFILPGEQLALGLSLPFIIIGGFGPMISAIVITAITKGKQGLKEWFSQLIRWRVNWKWYAVALGIPVVILFFGLTAIMVSGTQIPESPVYGLWFIVYPVNFIFVLLVGGGNEEPGWRGFALPKLQEKYSPLVASLILGLIWLSWHVPLFFSPYTSQSVIPFEWYIPNIIGISIITTWLYNGTVRSVLLAAMLHAGLNAIASFYPYSITIGPFPAYALLTMGTWIIVSLIFLLDRAALTGQVKTEIKMTG